MCSASVSRFALVAGMALIGGLSSACGPTVPLKKTTQFKPQHIRTLYVEDVCRLQEWFDKKPAPNRMLTQVGVESKDKDGHLQEYGTTSYRVTDSRQQGMFMMLLRRFYRYIPTIAMKRSFDVSLAFYRVSGKVRMQPGTTITLSADGRTTELAYHPCIGEFLLSRDLYRSRKRYVVSTVIAESTE